MEDLFILLFFLGGVFFVVFLYCYQKMHPEKVSKPDDVIVSSAQVITPRKTYEQINTNSEKKTVKVNFSVKGTIYRNAEGIRAAQNVSVGDSLFLKDEDDNEQDIYAMKVLTDRGAHIGYVEKRYSKPFYLNMDKLINCKVTKVTTDDIPYIYADAFFKEGATVCDEESEDWINVKISTAKSRAMESNEDLDFAERIKYSHPEKAVEIFLDAASKETGLYSAHQVCLCYRQMKAYDKEKEMIQQIIQVCKDEGLDDYIETYESRLKSVEYFINRNKKKEELDLAKKKVKEGDYDGAIEIFLKYYDKDNLILSIANGLIKCYNKKGMHEQEEKVREDLSRRKKELEKEKQIKKEKFMKEMAKWREKNYKDY